MITMKDNYNLVNEEISNYKWDYLPANSAYLQEMDTYLINLLCYPYDGLVRTVKIIRGKGNGQEASLGLVLGLRLI
jgi:hypothetical protein